MFFCLLNESYILTLESGKVSGGENHLLVCILETISFFARLIMSFLLQQQHHLNVAERNLSWLTLNFSLCVSLGQRLVIAPPRSPPPVVSLGLSTVQPSLCSSV